MFNLFTRILPCTLLVLSSCTDRDFHEKVFRNLQRLCPGQYVSGDSHKVIHNETRKPGDCCTDRFNLSASEYHGLKLTSDRDQTFSCLFPQTRVPVSRQTARSFYMITHAPKDGCATRGNVTENKNDVSQVTCNDTELDPLQRLHPVYSNSNGFLYKNPHCALCHGQHRVTLWQVVASCSMDRPLSNDLDTCQYYFVYPGEYNDIQHLECFTSDFNACPDDAAKVKIPTDVDLSFDELSAACAMDNLPRYTGIFFAKNAFCYICQYCHPNSQCARTKCSNPDSFKYEKDTGNPSFIRLLDLRVIGQTGLQHDYVCGLDTDRTVCHQVLCPTGQVFISNGDGPKCKMDSTQWTGTQNKVAMWLLLAFDHQIELNDTVLERMFTHDLVKHPWQGSWRIVQALTPLATNVTLVRTGTNRFNISTESLFAYTTHALVQLSFLRKNVDPVSFVRHIQESLPELWHFNDGDRTYTAGQSLSRCTFVRVMVTREHAPAQRYLVPPWLLSTNRTLQERVLYRIAFTWFAIFSTANVNKLMFCKQVELAARNFVVLTFRSVPVALFYNRTGKYLMDNEFTRGDNKYGVSTFRICISDTRIKKSNGNSLLYPSSAIQIILLVGLFALV